MPAGEQLRAATPVVALGDGVFRCDLRVTSIDYLGITVSLECAAAKPFARLVSGFFVFLFGRSLNFRTRDSPEGSGRR